MVLRIGARAVLPSPVRSFGLMPSLVVARQMHSEPRAHKRRLRKLKSKVLGVRRVEEAKNILMRTRGITDAKAYDLIRDQSMSKRVSTEDIALAIVSANEIPSMGQN